MCSCELTCHLAICRVFVWAGPLELVIVFGLVSLELGVVPAILGIGSTLLLIPAQVGRCRRQPKALCALC